MKKYLLIVASIILAAGCNCFADGGAKSTSIEEQFDSFNTAAWGKSDWKNGDPFNCGWLPSHVTFADGVMTLSLSDEASHTKKFSGAEYRTNNTYGYGKYEVCMKAAKCNGVVSSFFTYTGSPWDEIDIEFLGKDTTQVQFNYYVDGKGGHEKMYSLGFDASEDFHTYAFEWKKNSIAWYVDGKKVHSVSGGKLPSHNMQIMMNLWNGVGVDSWLNAFKYPGSPVQAQYKFVKYTENN